MTREEAEIYAKTMTFEDALYNLSQARAIPYRKATLIKVNELIKALSQEPMRDFTEEEAEAYSKALDKMYKPTGFNVFNEPCDDAISREDAEQMFRNIRSHLKPQDYKSAEEFNTRDLMLLNAEQMIHALPSVTQKSGKCKECKYFEYDSVAKVDGIPLIVAHEICNKWGDGCKTSEDGYCFLYEPQEGANE